MRTLRNRASRWSRSGATCILADAAPLAAEPVITLEVFALETWDWEIFCVEAETIMREKISRGTTEPGIVMNN